MNAQTDKRKARAPFHGVGQIFRFNWPRYVVAGGLVFAVLLALSFSHAAGWIRICGIMAISFAVWWTMASLIASYWVYDCSKLMEWDWVKGEPRAPVNRWLNIHAGLDESTKSLSEFWPNAEGETVDIFAPAEMTEDSIRRARNVGMLSVTLLLYLLFKPVNRSLSLLAAVFNLVGITIEAVRLNAHGSDFAMVFHGAFCILVSYLIWRSAFLPRILAALIALGGLAWLTYPLTPFASYLSPYNVICGLAGEASVFLWLLVVGVNVQRRNEHSISARSAQ